MRSPSANIKVKDNGGLETEFRFDGSELLILTFTDSFRLKLEFDEDNTAKICELLDIADQLRIEKLRTAMDEALGTWQRVHDQAKALVVEAEQRAESKRKQGLGTWVSPPRPDGTILARCEACDVIYSGRLSSGNVDWLKEIVRAVGADPSEWSYECLASAPPWPEKCPGCSGDLEGLI